MVPPYTSPDPLARAGGEKIVERLVEHENAGIGDLILWFHNPAPRHVRLPDEQE